MCAHFAGATYGASKRALTLEVVLQVQHGGLVGGERTRLAMSGWAVMAPLELFWPSTASMPVRVLRERDRAAEREERKHNKADSADGLTGADILWGRGCLVAGKFKITSVHD